MTANTFSWESLEEFIGRDRTLQDVQEWLQRDDFRIVFFTGGFGIGKTRLIKQILTRAEELGTLATPSTYIDLKHVSNHSEEGLARALVQSFANYKNDYFSTFGLIEEALEQARTSGNNKKAGEYLRGMLRACEDGIKRLSQEKGILILLDTAEYLLYPASGQSHQIAPVWSWLKKWIKNLPKGLVVLTGRQQVEILASEIGIGLTPLAYFDQQETASYIRAIAKNYQLVQDSADFLIPEDEIEQLYRLSDGRPILISLYLQLIFQNPDLREKALSTPSDMFEAQLIHELMESEIGNALRAAGRALKGIDLELFTLIRGFNTSDDELTYAQQEFESLKRMSFAKTFQDSERLFLHDQMYDMLNHHIYSRQDDLSEKHEAQDVAEKIYDYYKRKIEEKSNELSILYENLSRGIEFQDVVAEDKESIILAIRDIEIPRQELMTEFIFYRWQYPVKFGEDPVDAMLRRYYRFAHEAALTGRYNLVIALRIELINILEKLTPSNPWHSFIKGLLLLQDVWEKLALGENYGNEIPSLLQKLEKIENLPKISKSILSTLLNTWLGTSIIFSKNPDYEKACLLLLEAADSLEKEKDNEVVWFKNVATSLANRQLAYAYRVQGQFEQAIQRFIYSLKNSRAIDFYHEEATLRNDLGFAQLLTGRFQAARENIEDGLSLRLRLGIGPYIALSNSTLAQYHIAEKNYEEARKRAYYAVKISQALGFERGEAFGHLALAEATRRYAFSTLGNATKDELMNSAEESILDSIRLFENLGEQVRIIDAHLEYGCILRDKMRLARTLQEQEVYYYKAHQELEKTAKRASETASILYRRVDALCNLIWLNIFAGKYDQADEAAKAFDSIQELQPYWLMKGRPANEHQARRNPIVWTQIGKYHVARGMIALKTWQESQDERSKSTEQAIKTCATHFLLGLQYNLLFTADHRGLREGRKSISQELLKLNSHELKIFTQYVCEGIESHQLQTPIALENLMKEQALWFAS